MTGLALLAYLGAGYTHTDGKYAETRRPGARLPAARRRSPTATSAGTSQAVGMYCHAMATLALCEAYALTGDARLRDPVERAVGFLVRPIRAPRRPGLAVRRPAVRRRVGDTSILGWVVMVLKSAQGRRHRRARRRPGRGPRLARPRSPSGPARRPGRATSPGQAVTPTMTAEAWVCRQFLGVGGPGPGQRRGRRATCSTHGPGRDPYNLYYWYYGTLAMYQHGGDAWTRWNAEVRDQLVAPPAGQRPRGRELGPRRRARTAPTAAGSTARPWPR